MSKQEMREDSQGAHLADVELEGVGCANGDMREPQGCNEKNRDYPHDVRRTPNLEVGFNVGVLKLGLRSFSGLAEWEAGGRVRWDGLQRAWLLAVKLAVAHAVASVDLARLNPRLGIERGMPAELCRVN